MSYQVLARKWRPATFEQLVGQSHVLQALTNALDQQRLHHAYLFTGTRGVGKTTLARLFAKGLNCEQGITAHPCGKCASCVEIAEGRFVDLIEVDAASRTKVDDTRELLDNVQYRPTRGRFKVYLIDEVHMLSRSSFNALLKTLEEPPEHVKFLLATTDPQKLPVTVLSRCLQFNLKSLSLEEIQGQLNHILVKEQLPFEDSALKLLAKSANGSMRDALSLTDQAIAFGAGQVMLEQVQSMLGTIDEHQVIALLNGLIVGDIAQLMQVTAEVLSFGADADEVLRSLLELLHQITLTQFATAAAQLSIHSEQIKVFAKQLTPEQIQLYYQILLTGRKDLPYAPDPRSGLEMALLRVVAFIPEPPTNVWNVETPAKKSTADIKADPQALLDTKIQTDSKAFANLKQTTDLVGTTDNTVETESASIKKNACETEIIANTAVARDSKGETSPPSESHNESLAQQNSLYAEHDFIMSQASSMGYDSDAYSNDDFIERSNECSNEAKPTQLDVEQGVSKANTTQNIESQIIESQQAELQPNSSAMFGLDDILDAALNSRSLLMSQLKVGHELGNNAEQTTNKGKNATDKRAQLTNRASVTKPRHLAELTQVDVSSKTLVANLEDDGFFDSHDGVMEANVATSSEQSSVKYEQTTAVSSEPLHILELRQSTEFEDRPPWENNDPKPDESKSVAIQHHLLDGQSLPAHSSSSTHSSLSVITTNEPLLVAGTLDFDVGSKITGEPLDLHWYKQMSILNIGGRIRQLAVNSICLNWSEHIVLLLKPDQKHLSVNMAVTQLQQAISDMLEKEITVDVQIGVDPKRETPREVRQRFHRELSQQTQTCLLKDENVLWLTEFMGAQLSSDSVVYPSELMAKLSQNIMGLSLTD